MRYTRQNKIIELISLHEIDTQEKLADILKENGYEVTQATVSRDIKELQLIKTLAPSGQYKYALPEQNAKQTTDRLSKVFKNTVQSACSSSNLVVVKTLSGCANAAGEAIDSLEFPHTLGSIAGDNTVLIVCTDPERAEELTTRFEEMLKG